LYQIAGLIKYCHGIGLCLGNIQPENFLIVSREVRDQENQVSYNELHVKYFNLSSAVKLYIKKEISLDFDKNSDNDDEVYPFTTKKH